jgi:hypothetical protein
MQGIDFMHTSSIIWHIYDLLPSSGIMALGGMVYEYACAWYLSIFKLLEWYEKFLGLSARSQSKPPLRELQPTKLLRRNRFADGLWPEAAFRYNLPSFTFCRPGPFPPFHPTMGMNRTPENMAILCRSICRMNITRSACILPQSPHCRGKAPGLGCRSERL